MQLVKILAFEFSMVGKSVHSNVLLCSFLEYSACYVWFHIICGAVISATLCVLWAYVASFCSNSWKTGRKSD